MQIECFEKNKWKLNEAAGKVAVCISAMEVSVGLISLFFGLVNSYQPLK